MIDCFKFIDESENKSEIRIDRVIIKEKTQINNRCEIFATSIKIAFCRFRIFFIHRSIISLRHDRLRFNERARQFNERLRKLNE